MKTIPEPEPLLHTLRRALPFSTGNYPYVTARVRAKRAQLLSKETYAKLLVMDVHEITRFLGESNYKKEIGELGLQYSGIDLIEHALDKNRAAVSCQILSFSDGDLQTMLAAYLKRDDFWDVKTILRGVLHHASAEDILRTLRTGGEYPERFWKPIVEESHSVDDVIERLKDTEFHPTLTSLPQPFDLAEAENALDKQYYGGLLHAIRPNSEPNRLFLRFIRDEIDLVNLRTLFMTKFEQVEPDRIARMVLPGGTMGDDTVAALVATPDFPRFLESLKPLPEYETMKDELPGIEKTGSLSRTIRALEKHHLAAATKSSYLYPLSVLPILDYLVRKRIEVENLRILARGKEKGLSTDTLKELLVMY